MLDSLPMENRDSINAAGRKEAMRIGLRTVFRVRYAEYHTVRLYCCL